MKYIVSEETSRQVREFVSSYLELDEYGATRPNLSYPVHSLYLDSDRLDFYWHTINGNKNRFKLRIRFYENRPTAPVYFEIKRRMDNAILKQRGAVRREAVDWLLAGHLPEPAHLVSSDPRHLVALQRFSQLMLAYDAKPRAHVAYVREAWISTEDNSVRVTMDRDVRCVPEFTARLSADIDPSVPPVFGTQVVLELKFTGRFPNWFGELVRVFSLPSGSAAKYADGVAQLGEYHFRDGHVPVALPADRVRAVQERRRRLVQRLPQGTGVEEAYD